MSKVMIYSGCDHVQNMALGTGESKTAEMTPGVVAALIVILLCVLCLAGLLGFAIGYYLLS